MPLEPCSRNNSPSHNAAYRPSRTSASRAGRWPRHGEVYRHADGDYYYYDVLDQDLDDTVTLTDPDGYSVHRPLERFNDEILLDTGEWTPRFKHCGFALSYEAFRRGYGAPRAPEPLHDEVSKLIFG